MHQNGLKLRHWVYIARSLLNSLGRNLLMILMLERRRKACLLEFHWIWIEFAWFSINNFCLYNMVLIMNSEFILVNWSYEVETNLYSLKNSYSEMFLFLVSRNLLLLIINYDESQIFCCTETLLVMLKSTRESLVIFDQVNQFPKPVLLNFCLYIYRQNDCSVKIFWKIWTIWHMKFTR